MLLPGQGKRLPRYSGHCVPRHNIGRACRRGLPEELRLPHMGITQSRHPTGDVISRRPIGCAHAHEPTSVPLGPRTVGVPVVPAAVDPGAHRAIAERTIKRPLSEASICTVHTVCRQGYIPGWNKPRCLPIRLLRIDASIVRRAVEVREEPCRVCPPPGSEDWVAVVVGGNVETHIVTACLLRSQFQAVVTTRDPALQADAARLNRVWGVVAEPDMRFGIKVERILVGNTGISHYQHAVG